MNRTLASIDSAIAEVAAGRPIIVVDDEDRENEGDLIMAAELVSEDWMGFIIRHSSGVVCAPMPRAVANRLHLPPMVVNNEDPKGTAYTVSCDAVDGTSTGISAGDRALTARTLADPHSVPAQLSRPGHMFPLVAVDGGVRERPGHTEAGVEFSRLAGLAPVAVIAELVHDDGSMQRLDDLLAFGEEHGLVTVSIADLVSHLEARASSQVARLDQVSTGPEVDLPTAHGTLRARTFTVNGVEHFVVRSPLTPVSGEDAAGAAPLVRLHSECLTGDVFGSYRCDCGEQLDASLERIAKEGGYVLYMRNHEGRGIGLANKIAAYRLQDEGADTVDANRRLGLPDDARDYTAAAAILTRLGAERVRLLTNNPAKAAALSGLGIEVVDQVDIHVPVRPENARYLATKRDRMHHTLPA